MRKRHWHLHPGETESLVVRSIEATDVELLRVEKNRHKQYFFHSEEITPEQQSLWFQGLEAREDDYMFLILVDEEPVGSIGFRLTETDVDFYNLMLWSHRHRRSGYMASAFWGLKQLAEHLYPDRPLRVRVLSSNPAKDWYLRHGFSPVGHSAYEDGREYVVMELTDNPEGARES